jgi:hypothetical protein
MASPSGHHHARRKHKRCEQHGKKYPFHFHHPSLALPVHTEYLMFYGVMVDLDHTNSCCKWPANNRVKSEVWNHPLITTD